MRKGQSIVHWSVLFRIDSVWNVFKLIFCPKGVHYSPMFTIVMIVFNYVVLMVILFFRNINFTEPCTLKMHF